MATYDDYGIVEQPHLLRAGPVKLAAYRVRDIHTGEMGPLQFHATYDNTVLAVMGVEAAKLFTKFVTDTLEREKVGEESLTTAKPQEAEREYDPNVAPCDDAEFGMKP